jgi:hypothetical protein
MGIRFRGGDATFIPTVETTRLSYQVYAGGFFLLSNRPEREADIS